MSGETSPIHYAASQGLLEIDLDVREIVPVEQLPFSIILLMMRLSRG